MFFRIIIPNYNNGEWLRKCLNSVMDQTYGNYQIIFVDDMSTDDSVAIAMNYPVSIVRHDKKLFNGGARNAGLDHGYSSDYTLFLDSDDWFVDENVLKRMHDRLEETPVDCLTLPYKCLIKKSLFSQELIRNTRKDLVDSVFVACWTKCIRSELIVPFPENTLMEDVVQHIAQADVCETFDSLDYPCVVWNRNNLNSCSRKENQNLQQGKWQSSMYRYAADLLDLKVSHEECEAQRQKRIETVLNNIRKGVYIQ